MKFKDIPQFTHNGSYRINVCWKYLEDTLNRYMIKDGLILNPDFQRGHVWTRNKQINYVEYILKGGKSSREIYFNCPGWMTDFDGPLVLVDGKQRVEAVRAFLRDEFKVFNTYYSDFADELRSSIGPDFLFNINDLKTRAEVLQWYLDLNTGGVVHTDEEIGKVKELLKAEKIVRKPV